MMSQFFRCTDQTHDIVCPYERDLPVKDEDDKDQQEGQQISENPHQVKLIWTLKEREHKNACLATTHI